MNKDYGNMARQLMMRPMPTSNDNGQGFIIVNADQIIKDMKAQGASMDQIKQKIKELIRQGKL
jgi:N-methylhydantoinase B/oxoprolinase/acetone carboxylase alpha subunit